MTMTILATFRQPGAKRSPLHERSRTAPSGNASDGRRRVTKARTLFIVKAARELADPNLLLDRLITLPVRPLAPFKQSRDLSCPIAKCNQASNDVDEP
jgi:hypothetical protein